MSWMRYYSKKILGPYIGYVAPEKAHKIMSFTRIAYFFSASTLAFLLYEEVQKLKEKELQSQEMLGDGTPVLRDHSNAHENMRKAGVEYGIINVIDPIEGLKRIEFNREEYLAILEKEAYERARAFQEKSIQQGKELPKDAIKLV